MRLYWWAFVHLNAVPGGQPGPCQTGVVVALLCSRVGCHHYRNSHSGRVERTQFWLGGGGSRIAEGSGGFAKRPSNSKMDPSTAAQLQNMLKNYVRLGGIPHVLFSSKKHIISGFVGDDQFEEIALLLIFGQFSNILMLLCSQM